MSALNRHIAFLRGLQNLTNSIAMDIVFAAASVTVSQSKNRIFRDGKKTDNTKIGVYSNKSTISVSGATSGVGKALANRINKQSVIGASRGKARKYIKYKEYRLNRGRQIAYVDLKLNGGLQSATTVERNGNKTQHIIKTAYAKRAVGLENGHSVYGKGKSKGYGKVFDLTSQEVQAFQNRATNLFNKKIKALANA